jgi:hypothetical protein
MELVAACAVNVPGFVREMGMAVTASGALEPVAAVFAGVRTQAAVAAGEPAHECSCHKTASNQSGSTLDPAAVARRLALYEAEFGDQHRQRLREVLRA